MGYLASVGNTSDAVLRRAIVHGSVVASYTCEQFGTSSLESLERDAIVQRYAEFRRYTQFDDESESTQ
jgi:hypothetical protein